MPRGKRRVSTNVSELESELSGLKSREAELRAAIRRLKNHDGEVRKLEDKLTKQLSGARWVANQIREVRPDWDEIAFYNSVAPKQPTPRGRRPRNAAAE